MDTKSAWKTSLDGFFDELDKFDYYEVMNFDKPRKFLMEIDEVLYTKTKFNPQTLTLRVSIVSKSEGKKVKGKATIFPPKSMKTQLINYDFEEGDRFLVISHGKKKSNVEGSDQEFYSFYLKKLD
jgi:hypothetical protein